MKIDKYEEIPVENLTIGSSQARIRDVDRGIEELAQSIKKLGLLEPIVVAPAGDAGKYEIITGQRRFLAVQQLGWTKIRAGILDQKPTDNLAKAISLTENMVREDMPEKDYIDACTSLFRTYGSIKAVSEELGLPYPKVAQYVKFDQLIPELKKMVEKGEVQLQTALRAQKAATHDGTIENKTAIALASEMKNMAGVQQRQLEKVAADLPDASVDQILEAGRKQAKVKTVTVTITDSIDTALSSFAQELGTTRDDAAVTLLTTGLTERGYVTDK